MQSLPPQYRLAGRALDNATREAALKWSENYCPGFGARLYSASLVAGMTPKQALNWTDSYEQELVHRVQPMLRQWLQTKTIRSTTHGSAYPGNSILKEAAASLSHRVVDNFEKEGHQRLQKLLKTYNITPKQPQPSAAITPTATNLTSDTMTTLPEKFTVSGSALNLCAEETLLDWEEHHLPAPSATLHTYATSKGIPRQLANNLEDFFLQSFKKKEQPTASSWISGRTFTSHLTRSANPHDIVKHEAADALKSKLNSDYLRSGRAFMDAFLRIMR